MSRLMLVGLLAGLVGCGSATLEGAVREGSVPLETITITHPGDVVNVPEREFRDAMGWLAADAAAAHITLAPGDPRSARLVLASWEPPQDRAGTQLAHEYSAWCQSVRHGPADCLSFGVDSFSFESKRRLALSIAIGSIFGGITDVVGEFANPLKLEAMVVTSMATYLALLVVPEPISKGVATIVTITLYAYVGHELWDVVRGYERMRDEADSATTFAEVRAAGERFGHSIGQNMTRILIMVATARVGSRTEVADKLRRLPRFAEASKAIAFETPAMVGGATPQQGTLTLGGVIGWASEVVLGKGRLGVLVASGAMSMTASAPGNGPNKVSGSHPQPETSPTDPVKSRLEGILKRDGRWIGDKGKGSITSVREIRNAGAAQAHQLFDELSAGGTTVTDSTYPGTLVRLGDNQYVGLRFMSKSGPPTIDVRVPGLPIREIKFLP